MRCIPVSVSGQTACGCLLCPPVCPIQTEKPWPALLLLSSSKAMSELYLLLPTVETSLVPSVSWNLAGSRAVFIDLCGFLNPCLVLPYILWTGSDHAFWEFLPLPSVIFPGFDYSHHFISPSLRLLKYLKFFTRPICTAPRSNSVANADGTSTYPLHCFCW